MVDVGSYIGGLCVGHLVDKYKFRAVFLSPLLFISASIMFLCAFLLTDIAWQYYIGIFCIGFTIGGPHSIISAVIIIDMGKHSKSNGDIGTAKIAGLI